MIWLTAGIVVGFGSYYTWWLLRPRDDRVRIKILLAIAGALLIVGAGVGLFAGAGIVNGLTFIADDGSIIRFLIGSILGAWGGAAFEDSAARRHPTYAAALVLLAIAAPHLDQWLSHLAGLKTSFVEIQLTNISTATKAIRPDSRELAVDDLPLDLLVDYASSIKSDLEFITVFELPYLKERLAEDTTSIETANKIDILKSQEKHLHAIHDNLLAPVVSPLASCVKNAIGNGWNIDSVRELIRPLGDALTQLIQLEREEKEQKSKSEPEGKEQKNKLKSDPKKIEDDLKYDLGRIYDNTILYVDSDYSNRCRDDLQKQIAGVQLPIRMSEYEGLPHIPLIRAVLLWFINSDKLALQVLEAASKSSQFDDLTLPFINAALMYFQGDEIEHFLAKLEKVRATARRQQDIIKRRLDECSPTCSDAEREWGPQLAARAQRADLRAVNLAAFAIAEDAAQGLKPAEAMLPIAEEYSKKLTEAGEAANTAAPDRPAFLDTAALVVIVAEAKKPVQDSHNLARAVELLERARTLEEGRLSNLALRPKGELINIKLIRSHLATGRELLQ